MKLVLEGLLGLMLSFSTSSAVTPGIENRGNQPSEDSKQYRDFALGHEGDVSHGKQLFFSEEKLACIKCHTIDGSAGKAGPDLFTVGDKFPRSELIRSILDPSANIAVGYGVTMIETKSGEEYSGIIKGASDAWIELMTADGKLHRVSIGEIKAQRGSGISLMPQGLQAGLSLQQFTDLIEYLATLKQPDNALTSNQGMPANIVALTKPVILRPFLNHPLPLPNSPRSGEVSPRSGLVGFAQIPGIRNTFLVVHQTGKIWLLEKDGGTETVSLFADFAPEIFSERGPNGLLGLAFHPKFRENRKYYLKHQVFEEGKIATLLVEKEAASDLKHDSGLRSRRLLKIESVTQDHSGGCIQFGPDGYLYLGMGDTGPQQDPQGHGQDLKLLLGKMLRLDVDHRDAGMPYSIPRDNPFRENAQAHPEIWALGFREPWRFSFDIITGDLWVGDVGQDRIEEIDLVRRGENQGWNVYEGFEPFSNHYRKEGSIYTPPVFAYKRKYGNSVTGGFVYRGDKHSSFFGVYIFGDYTSKRIWGLTQENRSLTKIREIGTSPQGIASFGTDDMGNIYAVGYEGMIYQLDLANANFNESAPPATPSPTSGALNSISPEASHLRKVVLATNLNEPIQLSVSRDGQVFFGERHGAVKVWTPEKGTTVTLGQLDVFTGPEDGLLGLALDPAFPTNPWIYIFHSTVGILENRVSRFTVRGETLDLTSQKVLLHIPTLAKKPNHSGGGLGFDGVGNLYVSTGDYTSLNDSNGFSPLDERPGREVYDSQRTAANSNDSRGKILRIHPEMDGTYTIPPGNLFRPGTPKTLAEIYIMGCRNPFRFSLDEKTGWLFWGDVGPDALESNSKRGPAGFDEFNLAKRAGNYGWPYFVANNKPYVNYNFATGESEAPFDPAKPINTSPNNTGIRELPPAQPALIWYPPGPSVQFPELGSGARSAMAGPVYHFDPALKSARKLPAQFDNALFIFDWERSWIKEVRLDQEGHLKEIRPFVPHISFKRPISMTTGPDGALYLIEWGSAWYNNKDAQIVRIENQSTFPSATVVTPGTF